MSIFQSLARSALFNLEPETAHALSIKALKSGLVPVFCVRHDPRLSQNIGGLEFPNPLGLAAGYDKNGEVADAVLKLGFGFSEIGTITPRAQSGNPKPRVFRLVNDEAVINRLGFNNEGHDTVAARLEARKDSRGIVGVNIGANKDSEDFAADYEAGIKRFAHLADYFTINISSPNTPGLRGLQAAKSLTPLLDRVFSSLDGLSLKSAPPVFLKLAPDLEMKDISAIAKIVAKSKLSGLIISNTTLSRHEIHNSRNAAEAGGLSGKPLFERSTIILARFRQQLPQSLPLIGVGGVDSAETAWQKIEAGASLVQLYTGMIYKGPGLDGEIVRGLSTRLDTQKISHIKEICGRETDYWAAKNITGE